MARTATKSKKKPGRPSKLEFVRTERICELLRKGVPRERAARLAGIDSATFRRWMVEGEDPSGRPQYRAFRASVLRAEDELISRAVASVVDAFEVDDEGRYVHELRDRTAAARFILPHRFPREFSTRSEVQASGPDGGPVQVQAEVKVAPLLTDAQLAASTPEQLEAVIRGLVGRVASGG